MIKNVTNPNSTYIKVGLSFKGYKTYHVHAYIDTGASLCVASKHIIPQEDWVKLEKPIRVKVANEEIVSIDYVCQNVNFEIGNEKFLFPTVYQQQTGIDLLIGNNFLNLYRPFIQDLTYIVIHTLDKQPVYIQKETRALYQAHNEKFLEYYRKRKRGEDKPDKITPVNIASLKPIEEQLNQISLGEETDLALTGIPVTDYLYQDRLVTEVETLLDKCCSENPLQYSDSKSTAEIKLKEPGKVIRVKPMSYSPMDTQEFAKQIQELVDLKVIIPSKSPHSSPAFLVEKHSEIKRGKKRMVVNYKELNKHTVDDGYFLPNKETLLAQLRGKKYFSILDCKSGFWQVRLDEESQKLTAFSCPQGHYQWTVVPFGLKQAPGIFQRLMDSYLKPLREYCSIYVDDILIYSPDLTSHYEHLKTVLNACLENKIVISKSKAQIAQKQIKYLGLEIEEGKHKLQPHVLENIQKFPDKITDKTQLQRFLGCLTYAEAYIHKLAEMRKPFQAKLKKDVQWTWTDSDCQKLAKIKKQVKNLPGLYHPTEDDQMIIETDASGEFWGAVLKARPKKSLDEYLCKYTSGSFQAAELNYHSNEKETLAVKKAIKKFSIYVIHQEFIVRTDNTYFTYFLKTNIGGDYKQGRLIRWQQWFSHYKFRTEHIKGEKNSLADALTREFAGINGEST